MKKEYNKLIRDKIPSIIKKSGKDFEVEEVSDVTNFVKEKIKEETSELIEATLREDIINEFADVYEILDKYREELNISKSEIREAQSLKNKKRGKFKKNLILKWTK